MKKKGLSKLQVILVILLIIVGSTVLVIGSIYGMAFLFYTLTDANDGYLSSGLAFYILCGIGVIILPTLILFMMTKRKQRLSDIKRWIKKYPIFFIVLITIILGAESLICIRGSHYYRDLKIGIQDAIMKDAVIDVRRSVRYSNTTYIVGYIDGKKESFVLTGDSDKGLRDNDRYKVVKIKYYKHVGDVVDLDIYVRYK